ncbi:MAG TPA: heme o synthase [Candidatus Saccharimonadales bacterium]|jgi:protoheme IX farnesyltransferase|nr:heme o synthase [Candidatus Saccharimonadales bacterium]
MFKKYYRLTKPGIIYGNALNTAAGFFFASAYRRELHLWTLVAVLIGSSLVIASGCVINNYIDRGIDVKMERTKKRALVQGTISGQTALIYGGILGVAGFAVLALCTNWLTVSAGLLGYFFYLVMYSIFKRRSAYGTLIGAVSGATPPLAGYLAVTNNLDAGAVIIFLILIYWQMPHFYAIAIYRLKDYTAAGIPVWPAKRGIQNAKVQMVLYILAFTVAAASLTVFGYTGFTYFGVVMGLGLAWLLRALEGFKVRDDAAWARKMFFFSLIVTLVMCAILSVGPLLP